MSSSRKGIERRLPDDLRARLAEIARRGFEGSPLPSDRVRGDSLPSCVATSTPYGSALVRSVDFSRTESGFAETFRKLEWLESISGDGEDLEPCELAQIASSGLDRAVFLDLETTGFSSTPLFLAGMMHVSGGRIRVRQFFAKDYSQEKSVLHLVADHLRKFQVLVTFNGKSYDIPFLRDRCFLHGVELDSQIKHLDLLHPARRRWRNTFPNCRLVTLEWHLCGRRRVGDVHGAEIPAIYHEFVRRGSSPSMRSVFHHNLLDLVTLAELLYEIVTTQPRKT